MLVASTTIKGLEECVCSEAGNNCLPIDNGLVIFQAEDIDKALSMHSVASLAELVGVFGVVEPDRRVLRRVIREILYVLRDMGVRVGGVRVWCRDGRVRETLRVAGLREVKRVYGSLGMGGVVWLVYDGRRLWIGVEVARRVYSRIWASSAGLNPMVAYCVVSRYADVLRGERVLEVFAGGATMALEACRLGASYGVGVELDEGRARLSLENALRNGLDKCYDVVVADALSPPFRRGSFGLVLGDPPRGWRFTGIGLEELIRVLRGVVASGGRIVLVLGDLPMDGRIVGRLRVGGRRIFVVEF